MKYKSFLLFLILIIPQISSAGYFFGISNKSYLANVYCVTFGKWFNDSDCKTETVPEVYTPVTNVYTNSNFPETQTKDENISGTKTIETIIRETTTPVNNYYYTNTVSQPASSPTNSDFLTNQVGTVYSSIGRSITDVNTSIADLTTTDIEEGSNLYYTDGRVSTYLSGSTTLTSSLNYWSKSDTDLSYLSGNVGIGTTTPYAKLSISGTNNDTGGIQISSTAGSATQRLAIFGLGNSSSAIKRLNSAGTLQFQNSAGVADITIAATGFLGIGTSAPTNQLQVATSSDISIVSLLDLVNTSSTLGTGSRLRFTGNATLAQATIDSFWESSGLGGAVTFSNRQSGTLTESMRITAAGNIGIGTSSPYAKLSVVGQVVGSYFTATTSTASTFPYASTTAISSTGSAYFATSGGNVGIGTSSPNSSLSISSASNNLLDLTSTASYNLLKMTSYRNSATTHNMLLGWGARGTEASPLAVQSGDALLSIRADGYDTSFPDVTAAAIDFAADEAFTSSAHGGRLVFKTEARGGTASLVNRGIFNSDGDIGLGGDISNLTTFAGANMVIKSGNVGIGTTSPYAKLSVTNTGTAPSFVVEDSTSPDATPFIIDASGNVGIGTTSPWATLSIAGDGIIGGGTSGLTLKSGGTNQDITLTPSGTGIVLLPSGSGTTPGFGFSSSVGFSYGASQINVVSGAGTAAVAFVGTSLKTAGQYGFTTSVTSAGADTALQRNAAGVVEINNGTGGVYRDLILRQLTANGTSTFAGNVGIGTTSPYVKLSVVGPVVAEYFHATSSTATSTFAGGLSAAGTSGLTVLQNGNVGIGTMGPTARLSLAGQMNWVTGAGAISHIKGPTDQNFTVIGGTSATVGKVLNLQGGAGASNSVGGAVNITGGTGDFFGGGGAVNITGGTTPNAGPTGAVNILTANSVVGGSVGLLTIKSGIGNGASGAVDGGGIRIETGAAVNVNPLIGGTGGPLTIVLGNGSNSLDNTNGNVGGAGGAFTITGGAGGNQTSTNSNVTGGNGSTLTFTSGAGGSAVGTSGIGTGGNSGNVVFNVGAAGTGVTANGSLGSFQFLTGNVGIGTTSPASKLGITQSANTSAGGIWLAGTDGDYRSIYMSDTSGTLSFAGGDTAGASNIATLNSAGAWTNASDRSYKEEIVNLDTKYNLETLMKIEPRFYTMKGSGKPQIGFIAQELKAILPEVVEGEEGSMGISYGNMVALLVTAIKEINVKVGEIASDIKAMFAEKVETKKLCLEDVCITKEELQKILNSSNTAAVINSNSNSNTNNSTNSTPVTGNSTTTTTASSPEPTPTTSTTTPPVQGSNNPGSSGSQPAEIIPEPPASPEPTTTPTPDTTPIPTTTPDPSPVTTQEPSTPPAPPQEPSQPANPVSQPAPTPAPAPEPTQNTTVTGESGVSL